MLEVPAFSEDQIIRLLTYVLAKKKRELNKDLGGSNEESKGLHNVRAIVSDNHHRVVNVSSNPKLPDDDQ